MKAYDYILSKQIQWANSKTIELIGSKVNRGRPTYTTELANNLFEPISPKTISSFQAGDGGELSGYPSKMQALHSSSALGVNIFQYWDTVEEVPLIAHKCGFCNRSTKISKHISFEVKFSIDDRFQYGPNIDVVINNDPKSKYKVYAIECKYSEAYGGHGHSGIKSKYLDLNIWEEIPNLFELAKAISPDDELNKFLHAAQLIKHILGLKRMYGKKGFRMLYLWYDALGIEGADHRKEINHFLEIAKSDGIKIHELSYQDLIARLTNDGLDKHKRYIDYIANRYL